ncbi:MAG: OB-fold nucleic acid binding domain-containing protein [Thermodesulfobacteriota bacterium]
MKKQSLLLAMAAILAVAGCSKEGEPPAQAPATGSAPASSSGAPAGETATSWAFAGKVAETMNASGYTYLLVDSGQEKKWVAVPMVQVTLGEEVSFQDGLIMRNFESKALGRVFEEVVFSSGIVGKAPAGMPGGMPPAMGGSAPAPGAAAPGGEAGSFADALKAEGGAGGPAQAMPPGSGKAVVPFADVRVEKAPGPNGHSVADLFARAGELSGKEVQVRGKVTKVSRNIMGKNWIHLQDGTGDPVANTHDLVVTSQEAPNVGDVVLASGVLEANKDFGSGYNYQVIVEDVKVTKE